jgi:hypothetical protein
MESPGSAKNVASNEDQEPQKIGLGAGDWAHLQKVGLDLPKSMAERIVTQEPTVKEHRLCQFMEARPKTDKVQ